MQQPFLQKILTGKVRTIGEAHATNPMDKQWETGMFKHEVNEPIWLSKTGLVGDEVADTKNHGGLEKAIFAYPIEHYDYWREDLPIDTIGIGAMGENLAVKNMEEASVCIGDIYQLGETVIQVSQPRKPCWKPGRRYFVPDFVLRIKNTGRTGWYYRVLQEGEVKAGLELTLVERPVPKWTIAACNDVLNVYKDDLDAARELVDCELLADAWKHSLKKRLK
ncbi:MOSC domain-containing protein [Ornithinibacillus xuwenensis]|uniref:MOSC domain-containing protein n=1 Tax=Ornithinibacillus xuwenensis TaxID=3144668 RepID=A0ABU9XII1_9BACI